MKCTRNGEHVEIEFPDDAKCPACDYADELDSRNAQMTVLRSGYSQTLKIARKLANPAPDGGANAALDYLVGEYGT